MKRKSKKNEKIWNKNYKKIEKLASIKSKKYKKRWIDEEDIKQEVFLKSWVLAKKYDPKKGNFSSYVNYCTENYLRNIIRDNFATFNPPKKKNQEYFVDGKPTKKAWEDEKIRNYLIGFAKKHMLKHPMSLSDLSFDLFTTKGEIDKFILHESIIDRLSKFGLSFVEDYKSLLMGFSIPEYSRYLIQMVTKQLIVE